MTPEPKVFCLGMSKTGTTSLHHALRVLGLRSCHHLHDGVRARTLLDKAQAEGQPLLTHLPGYDAFSDMALYDYLEALDQQYPGSRWIDTRRPLEPWLRSLQSHNERRVAAGEVEFRSTDDEAQAQWVQERARVHQVVDNFFASRSDDLLTMDIVGGEGWEQLCPFLGKPVPKAPFPHSNQKPPRNLRASLVRKIRALTQR